MNTHILNKTYSQCHILLSQLCLQNKHGNWRIKTIVSFTGTIIDKQLNRFPKILRHKLLPGRLSILVMLSRAISCFGHSCTDSKPKFYETTEQKKKAQLRDKQLNKMLHDLHKEDLKRLKLLLLGGYFFWLIHMGAV